MAQARGQAPHPRRAQQPGGGRALLAAAAGVSAGDTLLALVSGGGSALVAVPRPGLPWREGGARRGGAAGGAPIDRRALNCARAASCRQ
ncbi:MAG: DUF4147 domain-containing protein [Kofleriaceae bacterium]|nr:DUF4147 domain-containing protein [Kofleriaceae bacterium]